MSRHVVFKRCQQASKAAIGCCLQLEEWDQRTGVITSAKETTAAIQQRVIGAMSKAAENERVHAVVSNVSTGVSSGW